MSQRRLQGRLLTAGRERLLTTITVDDPELAAIFERIARAIPEAMKSESQLEPLTLLRTYAALLEEGASVTLSSAHAWPTDPELA